MTPDDIRRIRSVADKIAVRGNLMGRITRRIFRKSIKKTIVVLSIVFLGVMFLIVEFKRGLIGKKTILN